jgi:hypothetical protein
MRWLSVTVLAGAVSVGGATTLRADTIGTLDWFECSDGVVSLGDASNGGECQSFPQATYSRFQLVGFGSVDFMSASVEVTGDQVATSLDFSPDPVGSFATTLPGPPGIQVVVLRLEVAPGVVTNLTLPSLFRPQVVNQGEAVFGNIDADLIVPEPGGLTLLATGLALAAMRRRRARSPGDRGHSAGPAAVFRD